MSAYDIDLERLRRQQLPTDLQDDGVQRLVRKKWLTVLSYPLGWLYPYFLLLRTAWLYRLSHNGQVCYLEKVLNDTFDPTGRTIYITDGPYTDPVYLYRRDELKPVYFARRSEVGSTPYASPVYLPRRSETVAYVPSFIVHVGGLSYDAERMKALINEYKLPGRSYLITA